MHQPIEIPEGAEVFAPEPGYNVPRLKTTFAKVDPSRPLPVHAVRDREEDQGALAHRRRPVRCRERGASERTYGGALVRRRPDPPEPHVRALPAWPLLFRPRLIILGEQPDLGGRSSRDRTAYVEGQRALMVCFVMEGMRTMGGIIDFECEYLIRVGTFQFVWAECRETARSVTFPRGRSLHLCPKHERELSETMAIVSTKPART